MIADTCKEHGHTWETWIAYDAYLYEAGKTRGYLYYSKCQVLGCDAERRAEKLLAQGCMVFDGENPI